MARRPEVASLRRPHRLQVSVDSLTLEDLDAIGEEWRCPASVVVYWLVRGLLSELRREPSGVAGTDQVERVSRWLVGRFPESLGVGLGTTRGGPLSAADPGAVAVERCPKCGLSVSLGDSPRSS